MDRIQHILESELIERLKAGDELAFELFFRYYYAGLVVFARQIILDDADAEEIVQSFFVQLWEDRSRLRRAVSLKSYLFTSIKNRSLNYLKSKGIKEKIHSQIKTKLEDDFLFQPDVFVASELQSEIEKAILKLPNRCREIFLKSRIDGTPNAEIAVELDISKRTVETQVSKALRILRVELKDYLSLLTFLGII